MNSNDVEAPFDRVADNIWIVSKASSFARFVGQKLPVAIDGFTDAIKRTTLNIIAELDELERQSTMTEIPKSREHDENYLEPMDKGASKSANSNLTFSRLPWEILFEDKSLIFRNDEVLKARILALSTDETNFLTPFSYNGKSSFYENSAKASLIHRIFQHDENIHTVYSMLIDRQSVDDKTFWKNYFFHCNQLREIRRNELTGYDDELDAEIIQIPDSSCSLETKPFDRSILENDVYESDSTQDEFVIIT